MFPTCMSRFWAEDGSGCGTGLAPLPLDSRGDISAHDQWAINQCMHALLRHRAGHDSAARCRALLRTSILDRGEACAARGEGLPLSRAEGPPRPAIKGNMEGGETVGHSVEDCREQQLVIARPAMPQYHARQTWLRTLIARCQTPGASIAAMHERMAALVASQRRHRTLHGPAVMRGAAGTDAWGATDLRTTR